tara:strand:+ start:931 stop:1806 length:876 start_codon:yes stop_codon:yes gene_type:complete
MTSHVGNALTIDRAKLKYTFFYYPGTGGHIIGWLLGLAHDHLLLPTALDCFPAHLKDTPRTRRDQNHKVQQGWCSHENVQRLNPYVKLIFLGVTHKYWPIAGVHKGGGIFGFDYDSNDKPVVSSMQWGPNHGDPDAIKTFQSSGKGTWSGPEMAYPPIRNELRAVNKIVELSNLHTKSVFLIMSPSARMRACYEKGVRPWRTYDNPTFGSVRHEVVSNKFKQEQFLANVPIDHCFKFNDVYNNKYIKAIESMIAHPLTDAHVEAMEKLVNRYVQITPPKLLKIINNENKLS